MLQTYISPGDFIDLYFKIKEIGLSELLKRLGFSNTKRSTSKWNNVVESSDFWIIPQVRERWNLKCTGNPDNFYEDYVVGRYLSGKKDQTLLSVGCGNGIHERRFAKHSQFSKIVGIDFASKKVDEARKSAQELGFNNISYYPGDFIMHSFEPASFDVVLFNSSLHHFKNIPNLLQNRVKPLMKEGGLLVVFEYVGPNRLQWSVKQLEVANRLLAAIPPAYRTRFKSRLIKSTIYRPGLVRMFLSDPSEAPESESILTSLHQHFKVLEEKLIGGDILHLLLKDIAHNFLNDNQETKRLLSECFKQEDNYLQQNGKSDYVFGVYQKAD